MTPPQETQERSAVSMNASLTEADFARVLFIDGSEQTADFELSDAQRCPQDAHQLVLRDRTVLLGLKHLKTSHKPADSQSWASSPQVQSLNRSRKTWPSLLIWPGRPAWWCPVFLLADTPQRRRSQTPGRPSSGLHSAPRETRRKYFMALSTSNSWSVKRRRKQTSDSIARSHLFMNH